MRPRKVILIVDLNEERRSVLRYTLNQLRFRAVGVASVKEASVLLRAGLGVDAAVGYARRDCAKIAARTKRTALLLGVGVSRKLTPGVRELPQADTATLVNHLTMAAQAKRGPKTKRGRAGCVTRATA